RLEEVRRPARECAIHQVRDDLRVRVAHDLDSLRLELSLQDEVVLDDAVMYERDVAGGVRMGVGLARPAVRRPAGVRDARCAGELSFVYRANQIVELADRADDLYPASVVNGEPGRIVAAVF